MEIPHDELSEQIIVNVRILTEEKQMTGQLQVNITDKIANLKDSYNGKGASTLTTLLKDEIIGGDDTFLKRMIKSGENFILISGSFEIKKWTRFPKIEYNDYFYMSDTYPDAVAFKPKRDIYFLGFGFLNHYEKKDFKLKFKFNIEG